MSSNASKTDAVPSELFDQAFPGGFTFRDEANALTAFAFRNGPIEDLHSGISTTLLEDENNSRITQEEMKKIMIYASEKLANLLELRDRDPDRYKLLVQGYGAMYCAGWDRK